MKFLCSFLENMAVIKPSTPPPVIKGQNCDCTAAGHHLDNLLPLLNTLLPGQHVHNTHQQGNFRCKSNAVHFTEAWCLWDSFPHATLCHFSCLVWLIQSVGTFCVVTEFSSDSFTSSLMSGFKPSWAFQIKLGFLVRRLTMATQQTTSLYCWQNETVDIQKSCPL